MLPIRVCSPVLHRGKKHEERPGRRIAGERAAGEPFTSPSAASSAFVADTRV